MDAGRQAMVAAGGFFEGRQAFVSPADGWKYTGTRLYHGRPAIELNRLTPVLGIGGIPETKPRVESLFFGRDDKLWRGYERKEVSVAEGKTTTSTQIETVDRLQPDPAYSDVFFKFDPKAVQLPTEDVNIAQPSDPVSLKGSAQVLASGDRPSALPNRTLDGKNFSIDSLRGKVVLLDAYSYSCVPCRTIMANNAKLVAKFKNSGVVMLGLPMDDEAHRSLLEKFVADQKLNCPQLFDGKGWASPVAKQFGIHSAPFTVLLDRQGRVAYADPSEDELPKLIGDLVKQK